MQTTQPNPLFSPWSFQVLRGPAQSVRFKRTLKHKAWNDIVCIVGICWGLGQWVITWAIMPCRISSQAWQWRPTHSVITHTADDNRKSTRWHFYKCKHKHNFYVTAGIHYTTFAQIFVGASCWKSEPVCRFNIESHSVWWPHTPFFFSSFRLWLISIQSDDIKHVW